MIYRFDDIELDTALVELRKAGRPVHVEPQVFDVLSYLVENQDHVVTKDELLEKVWGDSFISDAAVNSRLMSARRAIGDNGRDQRLIRTFHGRGFRFVGGAVPGVSAHAEVSSTSDLAAPAPARPAPALPPQITPLIGRDAEFVELRRLLGDEACRLLTLTGPGGIGKTRLATELVRDTAGRFRDGGYFVSLQPVTVKDFVIPSIADAVGLTLRGTEAADQQLFSYLAEKEMLLLLDNFEHLVEAADLVGEILLHTSHVKLLLTSREALNLREEWVFPLSGLAFPSSTDLLLEDFDAVRLFREHGRRYARSLSTPEELEAVAEITRLVEGMPLALELAASWLRSMSVDDIVAEIERSRDFLSTSMRNVPDRHRSLRAIFDESWRLMSDEERTVLNRLSVFRGSFDRMAAQHVAEAGPALLSALVDKSLLKVVENGRYQSHELLRQYSQERLAVIPGDAELASNRHCDYYLNLLSSCLESALAGDQLRLTSSVETELENIRAAWVWSIEHRRFEELQTAGQAFSLFFQWTGRYVEAVSQMDRAIAGLRAFVQTPEQQMSFAALLTHHAWSFMRIGQLDETEASASEATAILQRLQSLPPFGWATDPAAFHGVVATMRGDYTTAFVEGDRARQTAESQSNPWNLAIAYYVLTRSALLQGKLEAAREFAENAYMAAQTSKDEWFAAYCLVELANVAVGLGDFTTARSHYTASYEMRRRFSDPEGMALALTHLGGLSLRQGQLDQAISEFTEGLKLYESINDKGGLISALNGLAAAATATGDYASARAHYARSLPIASQMAHLPLLLTIVLGVGDILTRQGDEVPALVLLRLALLHPGSESETQSAARQILSDYGLLSRVGAALSTNHIDEGSQVLEAALGLAPSRSLAPLSALIEPKAGNGQPHRQSDNPDDLTEREIDVLRLIAQGKTNRDIADELVISVHTVANHVKSILSKANLANRTEAAAYAIEKGLG